MNLMPLTRLRILQISDINREHPTEPTNLRPHIGTRLPDFSKKKNSDLSTKSHFCCSASNLFQTLRTTLEALCSMVLIVRKSVESSVLKCCFSLPIHPLSVFFRLCFAPSPFSLFSDLSPLCVG